MKTNITLLLAGALALCASCQKTPVEDPADELFGGEGNVLIETTIKNADGATGQSYIQQIPSLSGTVNMKEGIQIGFSSTLSFVDQYVFVFPEFGTNSNQSFTKYEHTPKGLKKVGELQTIPNSYPVNLSAASKEKAYVPMYNLGKVMVINPATMEQTGEIDLTGYAHGDSSADPASGIVVDGFYYLPLDQINSIFTDENKDIYVACCGFFGYNPAHLENGFACISTARKEFDESKSWDISGTPIEGCDYKPASVYNCQYLGGGKLAAYVGIIELMSDNPYTARNSMPVIIDLNKRTIKMIEGIPCSDGHSVAIEYHDGLVYYSAFGVDKAGVFTYDPKTEEVKQVISLSGNLNYIHFFD